MDFESLVGSSAYLAKQLELRWFYRWELKSSHRSASSSLSSSNVTSADDDANRRSAQSRLLCSIDPPVQSNVLDSSQRVRREEGRLVRKDRHSMPFLRRNLITSPVGRRGGSRHCSARGDEETTRSEGKDSRVNVAAAKCPQIGMFAQDHLELKIGKRKRAGGDHEPKGSKRVRWGKSAMNTHTSHHSNAHEPTSSVGSFLSHAQHPFPREKAFEKMPSELYHDEEFMSERMKESWRREPAARDQRSDVDAVRSLGSVLGEKVHAKASPDFSHCADEGGDHNGAEGNMAQRSPLPPAYFHYLYMEPNNVPATHVEKIDGRVCPFCNFDGKSTEGLLMHCGRYHGTLMGGSDECSSRVSAVEERGVCFEPALGEEGQLHVVVRPMLPSSKFSNRVHENFVFVQPRSRAPRSSAPKAIERQAAVPFVQRPHRKAASLDGASRGKKLLALQAANAPASTISAYLPSDKVPLRQYFHANTNLPMSSGEWDEDSDGGADDAWVHEMSAELLDEFDDVSDKEKKFMNMWNKFIRSIYVIADRDIPQKCHEFVLKHGDQLRKEGLRLNLLLHLFNLWDSGVISSNRILSCMSMFDASGVEGDKGGVE